MSVYDEYKAPQGSGGTYLKLEDGKPVKLRLVSDPYIYYAQFKPTDPIQTKYAWAVYNHDEDKGQILQLPVTAFRQIQELATDKEWGDPSKYDIKITRTGTGLETKYSIIGSPNKSFLTAEQKAKASLEVSEKVEGSLPLQMAIEGKEPPAPKAGSEETLELPPVDVYDEVPF